jgi:adenylosuccinate synthase
VRDETNRPNAYQGSLRFAHPDLDILASAIADDLSDGRAHPGVGLRHDLAITCLDQTGGRVRLVKGGTPLALGTDAFVAALASAAGATLVLGSSGPSRIDVETLEMRPAGLHRPAGRAARTALPAA